MVGRILVVTVIGVSVVVVSKCGVVGGGSVIVWCVVGSVGRSVVGGSVDAVV